MKSSHPLQFRCVFVAIVLLAAPAIAQEKDENAATEAFKACREQQKYGDATSCWRAWLDKHRAAAHEAEVLYAEEKGKDGGAAGEAAQDEPESEVVDDDDEAAPAKRDIGLSLIAHGTAAWFFMNEGEQPFALSPTQTATYTVPSFGYGGGLSVGYSLAKVLKWPNTHVRLGAERLVGEGNGTGAAVMHADLVFEKGFALGRKLKLHLAVGPSLTLVELEVVPPAFLVPDQTREVQKLTSTRFGGTARVGLELALGSRLAARLEADVRINNRGFYEPAEGEVVYWDFDLRRDSFSSAGARLGLVVMF